LSSVAFYPSWIFSVLGADDFLRGSEGEILGASSYAPGATSGMAESPCSSSSSLGMRVVEQPDGLAAACTLS
jgi:hypothetical protein